MVDKLAPPVEAAYQLYVPAQPLADKVTVPVLQRLLFTPVGSAGIAMIVAVAAALLVLIQPLTVQST